MLYQSMFDVRARLDLTAATEAEDRLFGGEEMGPVTAAVLLLNLEGPSTQHLRFLIPTASEGMVFGIRCLECRVFGLSGNFRGSTVGASDEIIHVRQFARADEGVDFISTARECKRTT